MKLNVWELKQTHLVTFLRKYIAKIKTIAVAKGFKA
jgi:ribosomal protein L29